MMAAILNSTILDAAILHKINFTHSFWLNLMMAAILNSTILDSAILHRINFTHSSSDSDFTQKHSALHSWILTQTNCNLQTHSCSLNLDGRPPWIQQSCSKFSNKFILAHLMMRANLEFWPSWIQLIQKSDFKLIYSDSTWWWQTSWILPSWIFPSWIQPS